METPKAVERRAIERTSALVILTSQSSTDSFALLIAMQIVHAGFARWRRYFANDENKHLARFYRIMNEAPTLLLIGIVILAVVRPF